MRPAISYRIATIGIVCAVSACGGDGGGDSTGPGPGPGPGATGQFTAKIDGAAWASDAGVERVGVPITLPGLYALTGTKLGANGYTIILTLNNIPGPGTYPLGVGVSVAGGNALISTTAGGWRTPQTGADGSVTITTLTASRIEGTFNFTAVPFTGTVTGTKTVTDGSFKVDVKPTGTVGALPENAGGKVSATLNGAAFNAADVSGIYSASSTGILTVVGTNSTRSLAISLAGIPANATGTFALSGATSRSISMTLVNGTQVQGAYSSSVGGGSGSVTITSFTATRIKGTFTATLGAALAPATGTMSITNGTFDIGRP
jgi:hypothetical protein